MNQSNFVVSLDKQCPICKTTYELYMDVNEHPNSMFSITSCDHINITRCSHEEDAQGVLDSVIEEIIQYQNKSLTSS
jgi:phage FluMu protein Com